jgi:exosortase D (VPLPA-CTERM-specific)
MLLALPAKKSDVSFELRIAVAAAALVLLFFAFGGPLLELVRRWNQQEEYSHGYLIPVVAAWLLYMRRGALRANIATPSYVGLGLIVLAIAMNVVGTLSAIFILSQVGFVLSLFGLALAIGGFPLLRAAFIPIAYLLFAIPLPYFIDAALTLKLQLISSELGVFFIRLFGIPVYLDGNIIDMGIYKLQVVEACSGLRYLYPLFSLSFLAAYLFRAPLWQRAVVFLSSIPIAIGMNGLRIGLVGYLVNGWGTRMAEGALHLFEGWVVFLACSAILAAEMWLLARFSGRRFVEIFYVPTDTAFEPAAPVEKSRQSYALWAALGLSCVSALAMLFISGRAEIIPERTQFVSFPTHIGQWQGHIGSLDKDTEQFLKVDDYILADYTGPDRKAINFYVAYYASQRANESPHSPTVCLPGSGWIISQLERRSFVSDGTSRPYNRVIIQKGSSRDLVYYWFDERGRGIADEYAAKWYLLVDAIFQNRTDGALVRLVTQIAPGETDAEADQRMQSFMQAALPHLPEFVPPATPAPIKSAQLDK